MGSGLSGPRERGGQDLRCGGGGQRGGVGIGETQVGRGRGCRRLAAPPAAAARRRTGSFGVGQARVTVTRRRRTRAFVMTLGRLWAALGCFLSGSGFPPREPDQPFVLPAVRFRFTTVQVRKSWPPPVHDDGSGLQVFCFYIPPVQLRILVNLLYFFKNMKSAVSSRKEKEYAATAPFDMGTFIFR